MEEDEGTRGRPDARAVWEGTVARVQAVVPAKMCESWLRGVEPIGMKDGAFVVQVKDRYQGDGLLAQLRAPVEMALAECMGVEGRVTVTVTSPDTS